MKRKYFLHILCFLVGVSSVQAVSTSQQVRLGLVGARLISQLAAMKFEEQGIHKKRLGATLIAAISHVSEAFLAPYQDVASKNTYGNALFWKGLKTSEEYKVLKRAASLPEAQQQEFLKIYYFCEKSETLEKHFGSDDWWYEKPAKKKLSMKNRIRVGLMLLGALATGYAICDNGDNQKKTEIAIIIQSITDLLLQLFEKRYGLNSFVSKVEYASSAMPMIYNIGRMSFSLATEKEEVLGQTAEKQEITFPEQYLHDFFYDCDDFAEVARCPICFQTRFYLDERGCLVEDKGFNYVQLNCGHIGCSGIGFDGECSFATEAECPVCRGLVTNRRIIRREEMGDRDVIENLLRQAD